MTDAVLQRFGVRREDQIGHGGDATVYALGGDRLLRVLHSSRSPVAQIASFYDELAGQDPGFALPRVVEYGEIDGTAYSIDRLIAGRPLIDVRPELSGERRRQALDAYLDGAEAMGRLRVERPFYGEILAETPVQRSTWTDFLLDRSDAALAPSGGYLADDVPDLEEVVAAVRRRIAGLPEVPERRLVHGDYFPGNVMIGDDLAISGVIDFGTLTVIGDPAMDVASAIIFAWAMPVQSSPESEVAPKAVDSDDVAYLTRRAIQARGEGFIDLIRTYREYYALRLAPYAKRDDPRLYAWCVRSLRGAVTT